MQILNYRLFKCHGTNLLQPNKVLKRDYADDTRVLDPGESKPKSVS